SDAHGGAHPRDPNRTSLRAPQRSRSSSISSGAEEERSSDSGKRTSSIAAPSRGFAHKRAKAKNGYTCPAVRKKSGNRSSASTQRTRAESSRSCSKTEVSSSAANALSSPAATAELVARFP